MVEGDFTRVAEIGDEDMAMLRYVANLGLFPETTVEMGAVAPNGPAALRIDGMSVFDRQARPPSAFSYRT
jgi:hypothetical protein